MKKTITCKFEYEGKKYTKKAILCALSSGTYILDEKKPHDGIDIWEEDILDRGIWSVMLEFDNNLYLEVQFAYNAEKYELTFDYKYAIVWGEDCILDEIPCNVKVTTKL